MSTKVEEIPSLSTKEALILSMLVGAREKFGNQLVKESDGDLKRGTVYVTLERMEDKGFIESRLEAEGSGASGLPKRLYKVTALGAAALKAQEKYSSILRLAMGGAQ